MADYQLTDSTTVLRRADNAHIPDDPANRDRQTYDEWRAAGGVPDPPEPPSQAAQAVQAVQAAGLAEARDLNAHGKTKDAVDKMLDWMEHRTGV